MKAFDWWSNYLDWMGRGVVMDKVLVLNQVEVEGDLMSQGMKGILWNEPSIE